MGQWSACLVVLHGQEFKQCPHPFHETMKKKNWRSGVQAEVQKKIGLPRLVQFKIFKIKSINF